MSAALLTDASFGTSNAIGRYFGVISAIPSLLLVFWVFLLLASGAWTSTPSAARAADTLSGLGWGEAAILLAGALLLALVLHPLQFAIVQVLEGYWGSNAVMQRVRRQRTLVHVRRVQAADDMCSRAEARLEQSPEAAEALTGDGLRSDPSVAAGVVQAGIEMEIGKSIRARYPDEPTHIMATRLGNVLRKYESTAGAPYGLPLLEYATPLGLVAKPEHVAYVNDQRSVLDLSVRMCAVGLIATAATAVVMWPYGAWLLLGLAPYAVAWGSYRGAVVAAGHYGLALQALVDLNRFRLYEELHLPLPGDTEEEREQNELLGIVGSGSLDHKLRYVQ